MVAISGLEQQALRLQQPGQHPNGIRVSATNRNGSKFWKKEFENLDDSATRNIKMELEN